MAQPAPSRPRSGLDLPSDIIDRIVAFMLASRSLTYDEQDISGDAARCVLVGSPALTAIGQKLYRAISPRLGQDINLTEKSSASEMKALLKSWKLPLQGVKPELWKRIVNQTVVPEDCNDQLCPCSIATREMVAGLNAANVSSSKAAEVFLVEKSDLDSAQVPCEQKYGGFGISCHYPLKDVKRLCVYRFGGWSEAQKSKERERNWYKDFAANDKEKRRRLQEALDERGVDTRQGSLGADAMKKAVWYRFDHENPASLSWAADKVETHIWIMTACKDLYDQKMEYTKRFYHPRKDSHYKEEMEREDYAKGLVIDTWTSRKKRGSPASATVDTILAGSGMPACLHDFVRAAWRRVGRFYF